MIRSWLFPATLAGRLLLGCGILLVEFGLLEAGLRLESGSEAAPAFQSLFVDDNLVGHRLRPGATIRYTTDEFSTEIAVNAQGVRDDADIGPKAPDERRVLILGDSLVMAVQVPLMQTFGKRLETRLNQADPAHHWRVINGGVQGYGPVDEWLFYSHVAAAFQPDVVIVVVFVANDAAEAAAEEPYLAADRVVAPSGAAPTMMLSLRRVVRSSMVLQTARVRVDALRARFTAPVPERPVAAYLEQPPPEVAHGLLVARQALGRIVDAAARTGAQTMFALMPARFQVEDEDYAWWARTVADAGGRMRRNGASELFGEALGPLGQPVIDLQPVLSSQPDRRTLFFEQNIHLTARGHDVVAGALFGFLQQHGILPPRER